MFYDLQPDSQKKAYQQYLQLAGSLSYLFSENSIPYLHYRMAENIFCEAFDAENLSRSDISVDAKKNYMGIGLKTFLHGNGKTLQKIAEFNTLSKYFRKKEIDEIVKIVSKARNTRISSTKKIRGLDNLIYHCVTRAENRYYIFESDMRKIDISSLADIRKKNNSISFSDGVKKYSFNISKSTLYQRFEFNEAPLDTIDIQILQNPIKELSKFLPFLKSSAEKYVLKKKDETLIYLPLYAPSSQTGEPAEKSGLNQWNAGGRARDPDEVYIPVPAWIHKKFPRFFPNSNDVSFVLELPDGTKLSASMCQQDQKGLMTNPNKALGKWLLRDVFGLKEGELLTRQKLDEIDIDSAVIEKISDNHYRIDFAPLGKYEKFKKIYKHKA